MMKESKENEVERRDGKKKSDTGGLLYSIQVDSIHARASKRDVLDAGGQQPGGTQLRIGTSKSHSKVRMRPTVHRPMHGSLKFW